MEQRLLSRNEGRTDDNAETIRKRFKVGTVICLHKAYHVIPADKGDL